MISFRELVQTKIYSFKIYTLNFQSDTRYSLGVNDVIETLSLKVNKDSKIVVSSHKTNSKYYANESIKL